MAKVIVAGSYPPIPVPAAGATLDAVRRVIADGNEVRVVSPRPSAAHFSGPLSGFIAGWRLNGLRRKTGANRLVFCLEPGVPFDPPGQRARLSHLRAYATAYLLSKAFRRFGHCTVIVTGETGAPAPAVAILLKAADQVIEDRREGELPGGVTVRGPVEMRGRDLVRRFVGSSARRLIRKLRR